MLLHRTKTVVNIVDCVLHRTQLQQPGSKRNLALSILRFRFILRSPVAGYPTNANAGALRAFAGAKSTKFPLRTALTF